jgi:tetratricopeptide (TPR) repeat protein
LRLAIVLALAAGAFAQVPAPDPNDLLARAIQLIPTKPGEAVKLLQQALRLDPDLEGLRYQLGLAYHAIGDEADAAAELREAVARTPGSADAHNYLGIVLFESGDAKSALDEFRIAVTLAPKDPNAHFNLGEAMARTGDSAGAVEELRGASQLAPNDAGLARLLNNVETKIAAPEGTIKVEVRQVLVPVVVTDGEGHHLTGLTQADFQVFEDGVEQQITAFSVEHPGLSEAGVPARGNPSPAPSPARQSPLLLSKPRRTYMVLIDTLHTSFNNLAAAREALVKLFRQERSADSQYVVVSLGVSPEMILNVTSDPAASPFPIP